MPNQNDEKPDQAIARFLRNHLLLFKEMIFESSKQRDHIAVWLVGMSTGSIALIISQFGKLSPALYLPLKLSVLFLTVTIILGLLFRIFHLLLQERDRNDLISIVAWLAGYSEPSTEPPIELPEDASAESVAWHLYNHIGTDMTPDFREYVRNNNDVEYWRNEYEEYTILCRRLEEANRQTVKRMVGDFSAFMADLEGLPPQTYEQIVIDRSEGVVDKSKGVRKRRIRRVCTLSYTLMCISFAISVLFISCGFIKTDLKANQSASTTNQKAISPSKQVQPTQTSRPD